MNGRTKFEVRSFTCFRDNSDWSFWWGCKTPNLGGRGGRSGSGMVPSAIVTFPLSLRVSEVLPLLCSGRPLTHPNLSCPKISPMFPYIGGWSANRLIVHAIKFPRFSTYVILIHQRYRQTYRRHAIARPRFGL